MRDPRFGKDYAPQIEQRERAGLGRLGGDTIEA